MNTLLSLAAEIGILAAVCALINCAILALRNPLRPQALRNQSIQDGIIALCILLAFAALSLIGYGIFSAVPNLYGGGTLFFATAVIVYLGVDKLMSMTARIKACDEGRNPFARVHPPANAAAAG